MGIIATSPVLVEKIWGGPKLPKLKKRPELKSIGESWEISVHQDGRSLPEDVFKASEMPYLVKLIDTTDNLSIQVHPGDEYAEKHENSQGKTECWLILGADEGCGIYLGFKEGISRDQFESGLRAGEEMHHYLNFYPVSRGDFFFVPAGSVHAIGKGVTLAEVQQSSGVTYRVWDWNRVDDKGVGRELHIEKAMDVLNFQDEANQLSYFKHQSDCLGKTGSVHLATHPQFHVELIWLEKDQSFRLEKRDRAQSFLLLNGTMDGDGQSFVQYESGATLDETVVVQAKEETCFLWIK